MTVGALFTREFSVQSWGFGRRVGRPVLLRAPLGVYLLLGDTCAMFAANAPWMAVTPQSLGVIVALFVMLAIGKLYRSRLSLSVLNDVPAIAAAAGVCLLLSLALATPVAGRAPVLPELLNALLLFGAVLASRCIAYSAARHARLSGRLRHRALILGAGHVGIKLAHLLLEHKQYGVDPVGFIDPRPRVEDKAHLPVPVFWDMDQLASQIENKHVDVVIVAFGSTRDHELVEALRTCDRMECEILMVPRLFELHATTRDMDEVWGVPLVRVRRAPFRQNSWHLKRAFDLVVSAVALVLLAPVMAACAVAVRLEGGPGFLFRQERVGLDGRPFQLLKFRTLKPADPGESATLWNIGDDSRVTTLGRVMRKTSLDELPQLWNIIAGHMSLVGPRPERPHFVEQFSENVPRYSARHRVPAGLTGLAQVHGLRGDTSIDERASFDNNYIQNWSLWGDTKIVLRTVQQVFTLKGK